MKALLPLFSRPSHYLGTEINSVHKDPSTVRVHVAMAFPDLYEVGMSYLGHKILYTILNNREDIFAERVYAPCRETGRLLREHGVSLATLESDTDIVKTHMFAFAITLLVVSLEVPKTFGELREMMHGFFAFGLCFQMPVLLTLMGKAGLITAKGLSNVRKYAVVAILVLAAVLTPPDALSQMILFLAVYPLYEVSILLVRRVEKRREADLKARGLWTEADEEAAAGS